MRFAHVWHILQFFNALIAGKKILICLGSKQHSGFLVEETLHGNPALEVSFNTYIAHRVDARLAYLHLQQKTN